MFSRFFKKKSPPPAAPAQPAPPPEAVDAVPAPAEPAAAPAQHAGNDWSLRAGGWELWSPDGRVLALSTAERALLHELLSCPGTPVGREQLIAALTSTPWDFDPHRLEVLMHRLRARVRAATPLALPVRALRGAGYLWVPTQS